MVQSGSSVTPPPQKKPNSTQMAGFMNTGPLYATRPNVLYTLSSKMKTKNHANKCGQYACIYVKRKKTIFAYDTLSISRQLPHWGR